MVLTYDEFKKKKKKEIEERNKQEYEKNSVSVSSNKDIPIKQQTTNNGLIPTYKDFINSESYTPKKSTTKKEERSWFSSGAFSDGYQFGDVTKTLLGTSQDITENLYTGVIGIGEKTVDAGAYLLGGGAKLFGNDNFAKKTENFIKKDLVDEEAIAKKMSITNPTGLLNKLLVGDKTDENSLLGEKSDSLVQSGGQLAGTIGLQSVGVPWWLTTGTTSFGAETEQAFKQGATYGEAGFSGLVSAGAEILTEKISGGIKFGGKTLDDGLQNIISEKITNKALQKLTKITVGATGEGLEEVLSEGLSTLGQQLSYEKEETWNELLNDENKMDQYIDQVVNNLFGEEARENYKEAFIGGAVLGGIGSATQINRNKDNASNTEVVEDIAPVKEQDDLPNSKVRDKDGKLLTVYHGTRAEFDTYDTSKAGQNYEGNWSNNGKGIYFTDDKAEAMEFAKSSIDEGSPKIKEAQLDITNPFDSSKDYTNELSEMAQEYGIEPYYLERGDRLFNWFNTNKKDIVEALSKYGYDGIVDHGHYTVFDPKQIKSPAKTGQNVEKRANRPVLTEENVQNEQKSTYFKYEAKETDSIYKRAVYESASKSMNDSKMSHKFADVVAKISEDKKTVYKFTNNQELKKQGLDFKGLTINGLVNENGEVLINVDSDKALNTILGHETTHLLEGTKEYDDLKKVAVEYAKSTGEYQSRLDKIEKLYKGKNVDIEAELTSDIVGEYLFTDEKFVKELSVQKPSVFKKIKELIDDLVVRFKGTEEAKQLRKLQKTFEKAYQQDTAKADTKYSLSENGEMVDSAGNKVTLEVADTGTHGTLMAIHNLNEGKMKGIIELGGIPVPSIAITNPNIVDHSGFGTISLLFDKKTIDPANYKNEVYDRDIWSPTQPKIDYNIETEKLWELEKNIYNDYKDDIVSTALNRYFDSDNLSDLVDRNGIDGAIEKAKNSSELKYVYQKTFNKDFEPITKSKMFNNKYSNEILQSFLENYNRNEPLNEVRIDEDIKEQFKKAVQPYYDNAMAEFEAKLKPEQRDAGRKIMQETYNADMEKYQNINEFLMSAYRLQQEGNNAQTIDKQATLEKVDNETNQEEFNKWVDDTLGNVLRTAEKGIYNGKDYLTNNGRRTFKQLHYAYNLENLVKVMTKGDTKGTEKTFGIGFGKIQAKMANQFESIEDIKNAESQIMSDEQAKTLTTEIKEAIEDDIAKLSEYMNGGMFAFDNASNLIFDYAGEKNHTKATFMKNAKEYGVENVPSELIQKITDDLEKLKTMPTDYFEAKPQRAVGLDEVQAVVIPNDSSIELKQQLQDNEMRYYEYDKSIEGDRQRVINQFDDLKFSLSESEDIAPVEDTLDKALTESVRYRNIESNLETLRKYNDEFSKYYVLDNGNIVALDKNGTDYAVIIDNKFMIDGAKIGKITDNTIKVKTDNASTDITTLNLNNFKNINELESDYQLAQQENRKTIIDRTKILAEQEATENIQSITDNDIAPIQEDTTPEYESNSTTIESPFDSKDMKEVGSQKVKAYQFENPEVKPFFKTEAEAMLGEIENTVKGARMPIYDEVGNMDYVGVTRETTEAIAYLKDNYNYTYAEIEKGLRAIIEDDGKENIAVAKRIEFMLDDRLRNGYTSIDGTPIPPNQDYINLLHEKGYTAYNQEVSQGLTDEFAPVETVETSVENASETKQVEEIAPVVEQAPTLKEAMETEDPVMKAVKNKVKRELEKTIGERRNELIRDDEYANNNIVIKKKPTLKESISRSWDAFQSHFVNRNRQIDKLSKATGNNEIKFKGDRVNNIAGEVGGDIFTAQTDNYGNVIGKSLDAPFESARKEGLDVYFDNYLKHQSNIERHAQGKGSAKVSAEDSKKYVKAYESKYPQFKDWAKDVYTYNQNLLDNAVQNGLIDEHFKNTLTTMYGKYVPFYEQNSEPTEYMTPEEIKTSRPIKRAKGDSDTNLLGIEQAMIQQTYAYKNAIAKNDLYKEIGSVMGKKVELGADVRTSPTQLDSTLYADENGKYLSYYDKGNQKTVQITDELYQELSRDLENQIRKLEEKYSIITTPLQKISQLRGQILTTYNVGFVITNPFKDIQDALLNTKDIKGYLKNVLTQSTINDSDKAKNVNKYAEEFKTLTGKDITSVKNAKTLKGKARAIYKDYQAGTMWNRFITSYGTHATSMEFGDNGVDVKAKNKGFLNAIERANNYMEVMFRYPEFKATLERGGSFTEALYNAREVTTNFGRGGTISKAINRNGATFFNTSVQGLDKFFRNFSGENGARGFVGAVAKAFSIGMLPALLNHLLFDDDEEYEALPDYIKDNYYIFKTGYGEYIRIPKGRMISVLGSSARRTLELVEGEKDAFEGFLKNASDQIGATNPLEENIFSPIVQAVNNEAWYGGDLVPTRLQNKPVAEQYDEGTDEFSKWLGKQLNISPYKINYVIDQYSGGFGDLILPMITDEAKSDGTLLAPLKDKFTVNSTDDNKYVGELYDLSEEFTIKANGESASEEDILKNKYLNSIKAQMSELYKEKREIQNSDLPKETKYERVKVVQNMINALAKEGLDFHTEIEITDNYSVVGYYEEYYKTNEGEWYSINDKELEEINAMGMTNEEKNSYFGAKNNIYKIKDEYEVLINEATEDEQDSLYTDQKRAIIDEVRSTNLTDEEKAYLYDRYYASADKLNVITETNIPFDTYLELEYQDFKADKNNKGQSISGSKKNKIMNFIESTDLDYNQKIILHKVYYPADDKYNYDIADYITNNVETYETRINILETLGFKVDENGVIHWD